MIASHSVRRLLIATAGLFLGTVANSQASPPPASFNGIRMTRLSAQVRIVDGVATTKLVQVLHNDRNGLGEAVWILPLPENSVADGFTMTVAGVKMEGDVLDANTARGVYEAIVRQRRDPGLLEYVGRGCLRARVFPIPANGDVEVEVVFRHVLPNSNGLNRWSLPLNAIGLPGASAEEVTLDLTIESTRPIMNAFSPTTGVHVVKQDEHLVMASFEIGPGSARDSELAVFYGLSEEEFGLDLLSYRKRDDEQGTFLMMIAPKRNWDEAPVQERSITFVLDMSGSMAGPKIEQAKRAVRFFLRSLQEGDLFNVIPFSTGAEPFFPESVLASEDNVKRALRKIDAIEAAGGTNIFDALRSSLRKSPGADGRLPMVVFLTDGKPTVGETDVRQILADARSWNQKRARVFVFGVGNDVNTVLLDKLAGESGGTRDYVREREPIEVKTSALFTRLSNPVLTNLRISVDGVELSRQVPAHLPDLFKGGRLLLFGRYLGEGPHAIQLSGTMGSRPVEFTFQADFAGGARRDHEFVPALWAERRIGVLLDELRLNGAHAELMDEVTRLGLEHNIVTPYTSHLIVEEGLALGLRGPSTRGGPSTGGWRGPADSGPRRGAAWQGRRGPAGISVPGGTGGGGGGGPSTPGPSGPSGPGPAGPATAGGSGAGSQVARVSPDEILESLLRLGVLPGDTPRGELVALAAEIAREMQSSSNSMRGLGRTQSGQQAVSDSAYLAGLIGETLDGRSGLGGTSTQARLLALFTRKVGAKVFCLRSGVWVDREFDGKSMESGKRTVEAFSDEYFALSREFPELRHYLAFSVRLLVVLDGRALEISAPQSVPESAEEGQSSPPKELPD